jgi:Helix-turn-helix domain
MSYQAVTAAFNLPITDHRELLALVALANHHNAKTGLCIPGQETLASEARCTARTMRTYIKKWEGAGYIGRKHRNDGNGHRKSDSFTLNFITQSSNSLPETIASGRATEKSLPEKSAVLPENMLSGKEQEEFNKKTFLPGNKNSIEVIKGPDGPTGQRRPLSPDAHARWLELIDYLTGDYASEKSCRTITGIVHLTDGDGYFTAEEISSFIDCGYLRREDYDGTPVIDGKFLGITEAGHRALNQRKAMAAPVRDVEPFGLQPSTSPPVSQQRAA